MLTAYGIKSDYPGETYDPDRDGPAPDDKWQYIALPSRKSLAVDFDQKVIADATRKKVSIIDAISISAGHEIEGHVLQRENMGKIPLRIAYISGDSRATVMTEGGAMLVENEISEQAFGIKSLPHAAYTRAMLAKLNGGNFLDCVNAFFDSVMKGPKKMKADGAMTQEQFEQIAQDKLRLAIDRSRRLFPASSALNSDSSFLGHSKDTVYVEQHVVAEKLKAAGLEKLLFVGKISLRDIATLIKTGFLDPAKIETPKMHALEIWNRTKHEYAIQENY